MINPFRALKYTIKLNREDLLDVITSLKFAATRLSNEDENNPHSGNLQRIARDLEKQVGV